ncbi:MAG: HAMP domain-containing histidine kinase [Deltaproteobacteria bacterium]|nr:HAMP domain-containing histidine kinase [Deltaproteobacteria bacterium]
MRGYVRSHLHRRIFVWFGATIVTTAVFVGLAAWITSRAESASWMQDFDRVRRFSAGRFALVWDDPPRRAELARAIARDLDVAVHLRDVRGRSLGRFGPRCPRAQWSLPIGDPVPRGVVELCVPRRGGIPLWRLLLPLVVGVVVLWAITGKIARKIARPLGSLTAVTRDLGDGKLKSRVQLSRHEPGEVGALADAINDMAERIERQLADQRELLAAVSHELRTPLSRIRLLVELLGSRVGHVRAEPGRSDHAPGDTTKLLEDLDREVVEIDALVGELLAASRLDFAALERKTVDGAELGLRALDRAGLDVSLLSASGDLSFEADPTLLSRALANLLDNARKHAGGVVALRVESRPGGLGTGGARELAFEVDDAGGGFREGDEVRVFQAFYRGASGDRGAHDASSLGLGLSLVRRIAEAHGGRAYAQNRAGGGATVGIVVPASAPEGVGHHRQRE